MSNTSIRSAIINLGKSIAPSVLQGTVISTEPLKIQIANDSKLIISELITVVPWHLTDYETTADIECTDAAAADSKKILNAKITIHNALKKGDILDILALNGGKKYYILDRVRK